MKTRRKRELIEWAKMGYGIDAEYMNTGRFSRSTLNSKTSIPNFTIESEADFILKVRSLHVRKKNSDTATRL